jgi:thioredoxin-related protein
MGACRGVKALVLALALAGSLVAMSVSSSVSAKGWLRDVEHALSVAQSQQRPLVVFVSTDRCVYCDKMIATTFRDVNVRQALGSSFVAAAIKGSERPDLMQHLQIRSFPTTLLVSPDGEVLDQMTGYVDASKFQQRLDRVLPASARTAGEDPPPEPVSSRMAAASRVAR